MPWRLLHSKYKVVESFDNMIWRIAPKIINNSVDVVQIATYIDVCLFNEGTTSLLQIMETMGRRIGRNAVQFTAESDSQRYNQVNIRAQHAREACISRSLAKNHQMEENLEQEGSLYGPGIDDDV